ncbi:MAG: sensor histidine kinase [Verrucomicrobia bacterium]|nr:sensor histidine kinase [Verrucomicrobiota bacterium]
MSFVVSFAMGLGLFIAVVTAAAPAEPLRTVAEVRRLAPEKARDARPVIVRGVVTLAQPGRSIHLQDDTGGTVVFGIAEEQTPPVGALVEIEGTTSAGAFVSGVNARLMRRLGDAPLPKPVRADYQELVLGRRVYERVEIEGIVRHAADGDSSQPKLWLAMGDRKVEVQFFAPVPAGMTELVDAKVRVAGVAAVFVNESRQPIAPHLRVAHFDHVNVLQRAPDPSTLPLTPIGELLRFSTEGHAGHRIRVRGVVTLHRPGAELFIQDEQEPRGLLAQVSQADTLRPGDVVEVLGFPAMGVFSAFLEDASVRRVGEQAPLKPTPAIVSKLQQGSLDVVLVSIEGRLLEAVREPSEWTLVMQAGNQVFQARAPRPELDSSLRALRTGSQLRLTGVARVKEPVFPPAGVQTQARSFDVLLRDVADVTVLSAPSWWTAERLGIALLAALALLVAALGWATLLRRRVAQQVEIIRARVAHEAVLEERQRVAREIHDTLAQSFAGVRFQMEAVDANLPESATTARAHLAGAMQMAEHGQAEFRRALLNLRAQELPRAGLAGALAESARQLTAGTGIETSTNVTGVARGLPEEIENNLLRIGQECVTNAARHAVPRRIEIVLDFQPETVTLRVSDDGRGLPADAAQRDGHFGLRGMRERAEQMNALLEIASPQSGGTSVSVTVPLRHEPT